MPIKVPNSSNSRLDVSYPRPKSGGTVVPPVLTAGEPIGLLLVLTKAA